MTYNNTADLEGDNDMRRRLAACAGTEKVQSPWGWVDERMWTFAAQPGWADAYGYAIATGIERPGRDETVITDAMILTAVQSLLETPTSE